jgi:hypothetical protein
MSSCPTFTFHRREPDRRKTGSCNPSQVDWNYHRQPIRVNAFFRFTQAFIECIRADAIGAASASKLLRKFSRSTRGT